MADSGATAGSWGPPTSTAESDACAAARALADDLWTALVGAS